MLEQYAFDLRLRALDAIQIAVALGLKSQGLVEQFVAADKVLCEVATLEGFAVLNPEHPDSRLERQEHVCRRRQGT